MTYYDFYLENGLILDNCMQSNYTLYEIRKNCIGMNWCYFYTKKTSKYSKIVDIKISEVQIESNFD